MHGRLRRPLLAALMTGLVTAALSVTLSAAASAARAPVHDPVPIRPNQFFRGFVNGHPPGAAVIKVLCAGAAQTGHPLAHQPVVVKPVPSPATTDTGFTGSAGTKIVASLNFGPTPAIVHIATFTSYFVKVSIPTKISVPCSGSGAVFFAPAPGSSTAKPAILPVTFLNIGT
jgi:hypothetical protein